MLGVVVEGGGDFELVFTGAISAWTCNSPLTQLSESPGAVCSSLVWSWGRTSVCIVSCRMGCHSCRCCSFCCLWFGQVAGVDRDETIVALVEHVQPSSPALFLER